MYLIFIFKSTGQKLFIINRCMGLLMCNTIGTRRLKDNGCHIRTAARKESSGRKANGNGTDVKKYASKISRKRTS